MADKPTLIKAFDANGAITQHTIVKAGAADHQVAPATAATAAVLGVATEDADDLARVDVVLSGIAEIKLGGTITRNGPVTAGAAGVGVAAAPGSGVNNYIIGFAMVSGVIGDIIPVLLAQGRIQG